MSKFRRKFLPQRELCSVGIYSVVGSAPYESEVRKHSMIAVVDYQAGNLYNVGHALRYLKEDFIFSGDPEVVEKADKVILPGVGSAQAAMDSLTEQGLVEVLKSLEVPFLGICLGLQLLFEISEEDQTPCLGIFPGRVKKFNKSRVKVPHIGWNQVRKQSGNLGAMTLFNNIPNESFFYFVHSYFAPLVDQAEIATTEYDEVFVSAVVQGNYCGVQFHPERSGQVGLQLLKNFVKGN